MDIQQFYYTLMLAVSAYFVLTALINTAQMHLETAKPEKTDGPLVSVLIPARDEEANVRNCVASLLNQTYRNYEILVIDDNSADGTWAILEALSREDSRVHVFHGEPLAAGWYGKPWALQQLADFARGDILLFTDADTVHSGTSISWAVTNMERSGADLISGYLGQDLRTLGEKTTVPVMYLLTGLVIPMFLSGVIKLGVISAAVGQYIVMKKEVFYRAGGYEAIKHKTSEDIYLSRYLKNLGYKTAFLSLSSQARCRMYDGYVSGVQGIGKNIFDFFAKNTVILLLIALAVLLFFDLPFPLLVFNLVTGGPYTLHCLLVNVLFTLAWGILFAGRGIPWHYAFLWPAVNVNLLIMILWSWVRTISGKGFLWKGRVVK